MSALSLLVGLSLATPVVYHDTSAEEAAARIAPHVTDPALSSFEALRAGAPMLIEGGEVRACSGEPLTTNDLQEELTAAESQFFYGEYGKARASLEGLFERTTCLQAPVPAAMLGQLHYLTGLVIFHGGSPEQSEASFSRALSIRPDLTWNPDYPTEAKPLVDRLRAVTRGPIRLRVFPEGEVSANGGAPRTGPLSLTEGAHFLQLGTIALDVELGAASPTTLVVPSLVGDDAVAALPTGDAAALGALLATSYGEGVEVWVVAGGGGVYRGTSGRPDFQQIEAPASVQPADVATPSEPVVDPDPAEVAVRKRRHPAGLLVMGGGAAVAATGLGLFLEGDHTAKWARIDYDQAQTPDDAIAQRERWDAAADRMVAGQGLLLGGGLLAAAGGVLYATLKSSGRVQPTWLGGPGIRVRLGGRR